MLDAEIFVIENAQEHTLGDGNRGREGNFDTEWAHNNS